MIYYGNNYCYDDNLRIILKDDTYLAVSKNNLALFGVRLVPLSLLPLLLLSYFLLLLQMTFIFDTIDDSDLFFKDDDALVLEDIIFVDDDFDTILQNA